MRVQELKRQIQPWCWWLIGGAALLFLLAGMIFVSRPFADQVFLYYFAEGNSNGRIFAHISQAVSSIPTYLDLGVFRPVSRAIFNTEHWVVFRLGNHFNISPYTLASLIKIGSALLLISSAFFLIRQYIYRAAGSLSNKRKTVNILFTLMLLAFVSLMVLHSPNVHPANIFSLLYLGAAAFSLYVAVLLGWLSYRAASKISSYTYALIFFFAGAIAASSIEIAYLAIPISGIHIFLLHIADTKKTTIKNLLLGFVRSRGLLYWAILAIGFMSVAIPTRYLASEMCTTRDTCYSAAELSIDSQILSTLPQRAVSVYNSSLQSVVNFPSYFAEVKSIILIGSILLFVILSYLMIYRFRASSVFDKMYTKPLVLLSILFISVLIFGSLIGASSETLQNSTKLSTQSWRDTSHIWFASAALLPVLLVLLTSLANMKFKLSIKSNNTILYTILSLFIIVPGISAIATNARTYDKGIENSSLNFELHNIMNAFIHFDKSSSGEVYRCAALEPVVEKSESLAYKRILSHINLASRNIHQAEYCTGIEDRIKR